MTLDRLQSPLSCKDFSFTRRHDQRFVKTFAETFDHLSLVTHKLYFVLCYLYLLP